MEKWFLNSDGDAILSSSGGIAIVCDANGGQVTTAGVLSTSVTPEQSIKNAKLLVLAPELLEALTNLVDALSQRDPVCRAWLQAQNIITKAQGAIHES